MSILKAHPKTRPEGTLNREEPERQDCCSSNRDGRLPSRQQGTRAVPDRHPAGGVDRRQGPVVAAPGEPFHRPRRGRRAHQAALTVPVQIPDQDQTIGGAGGEPGSPMGKGQVGDRLGMALQESREGKPSPAPSAASAAGNQASTRSSRRRAAIPADPVQRDVVPLDAEIARNQGLESLHATGQIEDLPTLRVAAWSSSCRAPLTTIENRVSCLASETRVSYFPVRDDRHEAADRAGTLTRPGIAGLLADPAADLTSRTERS